MRTRTILFCAICKKGKDKKDGEWRTFEANTPYGKFKFKIWLCNSCTDLDLSSIEGISIGGEDFNSKIIDLNLAEISLVELPGDNNESK